MATPGEYTETLFLSQSAQDFIEDNITMRRVRDTAPFLSQSAQDFIEEAVTTIITGLAFMIPEPISSGLH